MANTQRSEGNRLEFPNVVLETGVTFTAGSMLVIGTSGTNIANKIPDLTGSVEFIGVITELLTGPQTGFSVDVTQVFEFATEANSTDTSVRVGGPVFAVDHETVKGRPLAVTATTITGVEPIGICTFLPEGADPDNASVRAWVRVYPFKVLDTIL